MEQRMILIQYITIGGAVEDNNVLFANFCWRIVRTTETGGIKLIYNGVPSNGTCNNTGNSASIGTSAFNDDLADAAYVGYMYGTVYSYNTKSMNRITDTYYYGNDITYSNGTYTLADTITSNSWSNIYNTSAGIYNHHYTCFSTGNTCSSVYYIYYTDRSTAYYITLTGGKKVENALSEMLDYNTNSSLIKEYIDSWYKGNMTSYTNKLEDTIWCNDREISSLGGFSTTGITTDNNNFANFLLFGAFGRLGVASPTPKLTCTRNIDSFTVSSSKGNGVLTYPIGLLTVDEAILAGANTTFSSNTTYYLYIGSSYWLGSPAGVNGGAMESYVNNVGGVNGKLTNDEINIRPSVSLAPGTNMTGSGTKDDPYIVN